MGVHSFIGDVLRLEKRSSPQIKEATQMVKPHTNSEMENKTGQMDSYYSVRSLCEE